MAGRGNYRRAGKSAYKMTARRKAALRKAQLVSARKRKKNNIAKGILAGGTLALAAYGGHRYGGKASDIATSIKHKFRSADPGNTKAHVVAQDAKEAVMKTNAVSPADVAHQAAPINSPNMNNRTTPAPSHHNGPAAKGIPNFGGIAQNPVSVQTLKQADAIIDPTPPAKPVYPAEHLPTKERILGKLGKSPSDVTQEDLLALSKIWDKHKRQQGVRIKGIRNSQIAIYGAMRAMFDLPTIGERDRARGTRQAQKS